MKKEKKKRRIANPSNLVHHPSHSIIEPREEGQEGKKVKKK